MENDATMIGHERAMARLFADPNPTTRPDPKVRKAPADDSGAVVWPVPFENDARAKGRRWLTLELEEGYESGPWMLCLVPASGPMMRSPLGGGIETWSRDKASRPTVESVRPQFRMGPHYRVTSTSESKPTWAPAPGLVHLFDTSPAPAKLRDRIPRTHVEGATGVLVAD